MKDLSNKPPEQVSSKVSDIRTRLEAKRAKADEFAKKQFGAKEADEGLERLTKEALLKANGREVCAKVAGRAAGKESRLVKAGDVASVFGKAAAAVVNPTFAPKTKGDDTARAA